MTTPHEQMRDALQLALEALEYDGFTAEDFEHRKVCESAKIRIRTSLAATPEPAQAAEPSEDAKRTLANPPDRIYLQVGDVDSDFPGEIHWRDVTWSDEQVERSDLVYVRQPAPMVRLTRYDSAALALECTNRETGELDAEKFANAIMDEMLAKNGGVK